MPSIFYWNSCCVDGPLPCGASLPCGVDGPLPCGAPLLCGVDGPLPCGAPPPCGPPLPPLGRGVQRMITFPSWSCVVPAPGAHPCVELEHGFFFLYEGSNAVCWVHHSTQVTIQSPVTCPSLMLVLQCRKLDGLNVHAGVYQLTNPAPDTVTSHNSARW